MPRIRDAPDLDSTPTPSTLCKAFDRLEMAVWRVLLTVSLEDLPVNGITDIDASGFERAHTSAHYTKRTNPTIQQLKTTLSVDTTTNAVLDIHVTTTRKHDTQIAPQVAKRSAASISVLTGDEGYDDQKLRQPSRDHDIRPLIKHREFSPLHEAWNARLDSDLSRRRNVNETVNPAIKQKFGAFVRSRLWWKQFRELVIKCVVRDYRTGGLSSVNSISMTTVPSTPASSSSRVGLLSP
jgi:IS5 family transposase